MSSLKSITGLRPSTQIPAKHTRERFSMNCMFVTQYQAKSQSWRLQRILRTNLANENNLPLESYSFHLCYAFGRLLRKEQFQNVGLKDWGTQNPSFLNGQELFWNSEELYLQYWRSLQEFDENTPWKIACGVEDIETVHKGQDYWYRWARSKFRAEEESRDRIISDA